jgi:hypothetical protein
VAAVIVRDFDPSRDSTALRDCFIELQNYERQVDPNKPEGSTIAEAYLTAAACRLSEVHNSLSRRGRRAVSFGRGG